MDRPGKAHFLRFRQDLEPEVLIDLAAENASLRAALAASESAGVRRDLITQELKHRIGNLLALVHAIARKTFEGADAVRVAEFAARLEALAAAQAVLIDSETRAAMLTEVVRSALAALCAEKDRCRIHGPEVPLNGRRAHALTLALHELATNASKYGALSVGGGWVEVVWTDVGGELDFLWREHNGPRVSEPTRRGFGTRLITSNLGAAFSGQVELRFKESGFECRLSASTQAEQ